MHFSTNANNLDLLESSYGEWFQSVLKFLFGNWSRTNLNQLQTPFHLHHWVLIVKPLIVPTELLSYIWAKSQNGNKTKKHYNGWHISGNKEDNLNLKIVCSCKTSNTRKKPYILPIPKRTACIEIGLKLKKIWKEKWNMSKSNNDHLIWSMLGRCLCHTFHSIK
jgi:hypothetical protein